MVTKAVVNQMKDIPQKEDCEHFIFDTEVRCEKCKGGIALIETFDIPLPPKK